jgi:DivIVA domain-containing protein
MWFWVVVLVLVVGAVAVFAAGRDNAMAEAYDDRPDRTIPTGRPLTADDLQTVRFSSALRGYRMDEVDALLDRIAADLMSREQYARSEPDNESERAPQQSAAEQSVAKQSAAAQPAAEQSAEPGSHRAPEPEAEPVVPDHAETHLAEDPPRDTTAR